MRGHGTRLEGLIFGIVFDRSSRTVQECVVGVVEESAEVVIDVRIWQTLSSVVARSVVLVVRCLHEKQ